MCQHQLSVGLCDEGLTYQVVDFNQIGATTMEVSVYDDHILTMELHKIIYSLEFLMVRGRFAEENINHI